MELGRRKIPDPMIVPTITATVSKRFSSFRKVGGEAATSTAPRVGQSIRLMLIQVQRSSGTVGTLAIIFGVSAIGVRDLRVRSEGLEQVLLSLDVLVPIAFIELMGAFPRDV